MQEAQRAWLQEKQQPKPAPAPTEEEQMFLEFQQEKKGLTPGSEACQGAAEADHSDVCVDRKNQQMKHKSKRKRPIEQQAEEQPEATRGRITTKQASEQQSQQQRGVNWPLEEQTAGICVIKSGPPWHDSIKGIELNEDKVKAGIQQERESLHKFQVFTPSSMKEYQ